MIYAVIDTNVLVSAALAKDQNKSVPYMIIKEIAKKSFVPLIDNAIVEEYSEVLGRSKFCLQKNVSNEILNTVVANALKVSVPKTGKILPDMDDVIFYDVAFGNKDKGAYLVTGNIKHFPDCDFVVTPRNFLSVVNPVVPSVVNDCQVIYDPTGLLEALRKLNENAHKNGTAGMSEEEIEAEIMLMHKERREQKKVWWMPN